MTEQQLNKANAIKAELSKLEEIRKSIETHGINILGGYIVCRIDNENRDVFKKWINDLHSGVKSRITELTNQFKEL